MPRSQAQIDAARRNGAQSRGPVTSQGRAVSARNAWRHGLCARQIQVPALDGQEGFDALLEGFLSAYRPADLQEQELVTAIALASWQVRRAQDLELQYWGWSYECANQEPSRRLVLHLDSDERNRKRTLDTVMRYQARAESARARAMRELALYRSGRLHRQDEVDQEEVGQDEPGPAEVGQEALAPADLRHGMNEPENPAASPPGPAPGPRPPQAAASRRVRTRPAPAPAPTPDPIGPDALPARLERQIRPDPVPVFQALLAAPPQDP